MSTFFIETLPAKTAQLVKQFQDSKPNFLSDFYLSGGTALALQIGHRESEDLDFFTQTEFKPVSFQPSLAAFGPLEQTEIAQGTLNTFINGVQLQLLKYPYQLLEDTLNFEGIQLSSVLDIACTKLLTVSSRGSKKDFIDLFFLFEKYSLNELIHSVEKKYQGIDYSIPHILKSLVYFETAETEPMPRMHKTVEWDQVKDEMLQIVKSYQF